MKKTKKTRRKSRRQRGLGASPEQHADAALRSLMLMNQSLNTAVRYVNRGQCAAAAVELREAFEAKGQVDTHFDSAATPRQTLGVQPFTVHLNMNRQKNEARAQDVFKNFVNACVIRK